MLAILQKYFPEIVAEIDGIADGQVMDPNFLYTVLFSMYALVRVTNCSSFIVKMIKTFYLEGIVIF